MTLLDEMKGSRKSSAVLRMDILKAEGRFPEKKILIFEGVSDLGVYNAWIMRFRDGEWFQPVPGRGKKQLIELLQKLRSEGSLLLNKVRFFVDHDYDGVSAECLCNEIFVTDRYSIENYLIDRQVIQNILCDELRCASDVDSQIAGITAFDTFYNSLLEEVLMAMAIYRAGVVSNAILVKKPDKINVNLKLEVMSVQTINDWSGIILFDRDIEAQLITDSLDLIRHARGHSHRGKWMLYAIRSWLSLIYEDRKSDMPKVFPNTNKSLGQAPDQITIQSLAARSTVPIGLEEFVRAI